MPVDLSVGPPGPPEVEAPTVEDGPALEADATVDAPPVDEVVVRGLLAGLGKSASYLAADDDVPEQWEFTPAELDALTPPMTRIINRRPRLRAAVAKGDEALVAMWLASYAGRNVRDGREARNARLEREAGGAAGPAAPGAQGPVASGEGHGAGGNGRVPGAPG